MVKFLEALALVFITLKLAGIGMVAAWPWWWVLAPLWLPCAVVIVIILMMWVVYLVAQAMGPR